MSSSSKVIVWVVIVLIILVGGFLYFSHMSDQTTYTAGQAAPSDDSMNGVPDRNDNPAVSATDTSDGSSDSDAPNVDVGMDASSTE